MGILFGNILAVSKNQILILIIISLAIILILIFISRPLFCHSLDPIIAESQKIPTQLLSIIFFLILSLTVTMACQIIGALLVFTLLVGPGAITFQYNDGFYRSIFLSVFIAVSITWGSLFLAFYVNLPMSFCITMMMSLIYFIGLIRS